MPIDIPLGYPSHEHPERKLVYLGDGVYAHVDELARVVLQTGDGLRMTNTIFMEPEVLASFLVYLRGIGSGNL